MEARVLTQVDILADDILESASKTRGPPLKGFLPVVGHDYAGELMVIGRAVNGCWTDAIEPQALADAGVRHDYAQHVFGSVTNEHACPMAWVTEQWGSRQEYNTARSAFWRACRGVLAKLVLNDTMQTWSSQLVWSNLFKLAPASGGNPGPALQGAQLPGCLKLLQWELSAYRPQRVLFLTGSDWADPFLAHLSPAAFETGKAAGRLVDWVGSIRVDEAPTTCVVAKHPQGKDETLWVSEVMAAFNY